jgi:tRNA threonylcarbamoyladenosine biosynthesis protein TsaE
MPATELHVRFDTEASLRHAAAATAAAWRDADITPLLVGLRGGLGAGKTTWARAMLRALGYAGRVPSPTYTLVEHYEVGGLLVVHLDLYRLNAEAELENLGLRDWLTEPRAWLLVEWPERAGAWAETLDLMLELSIGAAETRELRLEARTPRGRQALDAVAQTDFKSDV